MMDTTFGSNITNSRNLPPASSPSSSFSAASLKDKVLLNSSKQQLALRQQQAQMAASLLGERSVMLLLLLVYNHRGRADLNPFRNAFVSISDERYGRCVGRPFLHIESSLQEVVRVGMLRKSRHNVIHMACSCPQKQTTMYTMMRCWGTGPTTSRCLLISFTPPLLPTYSQSRSVSTDTTGRSTIDQLCISPLTH